MRTIFSILIILVVSFTYLYSDIVNSEEAKKVAINVYKSKYSILKKQEYLDLQAKLIYTEYYEGLPVYYVFSIDKGGFVIISADDIAKPIIGYSFENDFPLFNQPPHFISWMKNYAEQIIYARKNNITATSEITLEWQKYKVENLTISKGKSQQPLLLTLWNQDWPYNMLCPADANGPGGHVYVGCVALSMGMVMKYYNHPRQGTGSHTNYSFLNGGYGNLTVNFGAQTYYWENMPNYNINTTNVYEIAKLLYHCSVAVDMHYGPDGSGSSTTKIPGALKNYFYYSSNVQFVSKSNYTDAQWKNLIKTQIDNKMPLVYQGRTADGEGHAWNLDGYIDDQFHMNWGWGGSANGYYTLDNLVAGGYNFNNDQGAVINIYPANNYPQGCPNYTISGRAGSFNDGSGNQYYAKNFNCTYLIQPTCASYVSLSFDRFDLGSGDFVYIYNGSDINAPLLSTLSNTNPPGSTIFNSSSDALLIKFTTDNVEENFGWYASYTTQTCSGTKTLTSTSGTISDGSKTCDYENSKVCTWNIQPPNATQFHITFTEFSFPEDDPGDYVRIYKESITTSNLIGEYKGTNPPPQSLQINASKIIVRFVSNNSITAGGFTLNYSATSNINELSNSNLSAYVTYENYTQPILNIIIPENFMLNNHSAEIQIFDMLGKLITSNKLNLSTGKNSINISNYLNNVQKGFYLLKLNIDKNKFNFKIII